MLRLNKDETSPDWIDPDPRLREDVLALKRLTETENPAVTRCLELESMTAFYLLGAASGQGFGSGLWADIRLCKMVGTMEKQDPQLEVGNQYYCQS